ncbi:hypothetical protein [Saccharothrix violaceirubra]|uniref:Uncharacterized protein n=1 Tax=Saccharothrix violaceirubra TaxID=413306 RepID=A0A7W7SZG7_9PSEU|nr:hypothetical protein [Saccharothrix violaceirubra]MBB4963734.1 hypothetical protein [Saccharothrix violaceirubra]
MANLVTLCGSATTKCHGEVESGQRALATAEGWVVPSGIRLEDWPVLRFRETWSLPGEHGWDDDVDPHPLQTDPRLT